MNEGAPHRVGEGGEGGLHLPADPGKADAALAEGGIPGEGGVGQAEGFARVPQIELDALHQGGVGGEAGQFDAAAAHASKALGAHEQQRVRPADEVRVDGR